MSCEAIFWILFGLLIALSIWKYIDDREHAPKDYGYAKGCGIDGDCSEWARLMDYKAQQARSEAVFMYGAEAPTMTSRIMLGFRGKTQTPLFMIWREFWENNEVLYAEVIWQADRLSDFIPKKWRKGNATANV